MKIGIIINFPDDIQKTNEIYQLFQDIAFKNKVELAVEVNGLPNVNNSIKEEDLIEITSVIVVSDIEFDSQRFSNKNVINIPYEQAINSFENILISILSAQRMETSKFNNNNKIKNEFANKKSNENIIKINKIVVEKSTQHEDNHNIGSKLKEKMSKFNFKSDIYKHIKISFVSVIPFIIISGLLTIFLYFFNLSDVQSNSFLSSISCLSTAVFSLIVPIFAGFIAMSISDSEGFMPGLICGALISIVGGGYISSIIIGLTTGYITKFIKNKLKFNEKFKNLKKTILVPLLTTIISGLITIYIGQPFIKLIYNSIEFWIYELSLLSPSLSGAMIGILVTFDFGMSVISKAVISASQLLTNDGMFIAQGAVFASSMVIPFGLALSTIFAKVKYNQDELLIGKTSWLFGISGLIPIGLVFAIFDPLKVILSCMTGSAISGILIALFRSGVTIINGGLFALRVPGAFINIYGFIVSVFMGSIITSYLYSYLRNYKE